tara:strand:+ start:218 stop:664 length:447 start_codon:yes stop_codon:yes gene_type:complete
VFANVVYTDDGDTQVTPVQRGHVSDEVAFVIDWLRRLGIAKTSRLRRALADAPLDLRANIQYKEVGEKLYVRAMDIKFVDAVLPFAKTVPYMGVADVRGSDRPVLLDGVSVADVVHGLRRDFETYRFKCALHESGLATPPPYCVLSAR